MMIFPRTDIFWYYCGLTMNTRFAALVMFVISCGQIRYDFLSGMRDFEDLDRLASHARMLLNNAYAMTGNGYILLW